LQVFVSLDDHFPNQQINSKNSKWERSYILLLAGAVFLGKRKQVTDSPANVPYIILGTGLLCFGWFDFNARAALGANADAVIAFANTNIASAVAMLTWIFFERFQGRKMSAVGACIGAIVGLVAITPAAGFVNIGQSVFIGFAASVVCNYAIRIKNKTVLDDTLDVFPVTALAES
jgi:Amt family ammonium transporter